MFSARYSGAHGDATANNRKLIAELAGKEDRAAYFYCALVFLRSSTDPAPLIATATWHGRIVDIATRFRWIWLRPAFPRR